ncbi:hypothetical protein KA082_02195, partial [Candidatus Woesebacteria bacterium]|nr:hypothetical protein [Candidatus Woesebacteria bacterium]
MSFLVSVVKKYSVLLFIVLVVLAASWPLFNAKMPFTHDFVHGARIAEMARALQDGHFPVRWSKNFSYGYGMPLFEFYAPFPFYLGAVFYLLGVPLVPSVKLIFLLATLLTAWGSYLLGRELRGRWAGLLLTALITLAPYRALNLFIRGAISEIWGITAAVWVLYTTLLVLKHGKKSAPYLILNLACLFLSHNLVTIIFLPFAALFTVGIFLIKNEEYRQGISKGMYAIQQGVVFAASYLLAIGVAAFYLFPAVLEKDYTKVEQMVITSYFNYHLHFLYIRQFFRPGWGYGGSEWGPNDPLSFFLGFGELFACLLTIICVLFATARVIRQHKLNKALQPIALALLFLALTALSLFFTTEKSLFIWEHSGILKFLQFPWRYLSSSLLFLGLSGIVWLWYLPTKLHAPVALLCIAITFACNTLYFKPEKFLDTPSALYYSDENKIQAQMSGILPDYIPKQLKLPI